MMTFGSLDALVPFARLRAKRGLYDGRYSAATMRLINMCTHKLWLSPEHGAIILLTRDVGHHSSGWFKNPDFERCWHLSTSYRQHHDGRHSVDRPLPQDLRQSEAIARALWGDDATLSWCEPPFSPEGRASDVYHWRLFVEPDWHAVIRPRGEVYDKRNTPEGWKSFSEVHGYQPAAEDAPFFARASE